MRVSDEQIYLKLAKLAKNQRSVNVYVKNYAKWRKQGSKKGAALTAPLQTVENKMLIG